MNFVDYAAFAATEASRNVSIGERIAGRLSRIRYQLVGAMLAGVLAPLLLRGAFEKIPDLVVSYDNSLFGTLCAILIGFLFFRKVTTLPGSGAFTNVLPAFMVSYGMVIALFFILRLDYSRAQFGLSFILVLLWFYAIMFVMARFRRARFGYVMSGLSSDIGSTPGIQWIRMPTPEMAALHPQLPLVVDLNDDTLSPQWQRYIAEEAIAGRLIYNTRQIKESLVGRVSVLHLSENALGHLAPDSIYAPAKLYVDVFAATLALCVLSPLLVVIAAAIRLDSRGPAIFRQVRMGYRGEPFTVFKFRSMRVQAEGQGDTRADMTRTDDDRITGVGRFIRRTRIDELPQLVNILLGQMSWIGPRPETLNLSHWYETEIPFYRYRHIVRPGITGWAQVKQGHVTSVDDVREKLEFDFFYVKNFSLWIDILIVIQTIRVMLTGSGSK